LPGKALSCPGKHFKPARTASIHRLDPFLLTGIQVSMPVRAFSLAHQLFGYQTIKAAAQRYGFFYIALRRAASIIAPLSLLLEFLPETGTMLGFRSKVYLIKTKNFIGGETRPASVGTVIGLDHTTYKGAFAINGDSI
jgi:hypothetical protein